MLHSLKLRLVFSLVSRHNGGHFSPENVKYVAFHGSSCKSITFFLLFVLVPPAQDRGEQNPPH